MKIVRDLLITILLLGLVIIEAFISSYVSKVTAKTSAEQKIVEQDLIIRIRSAEIKRLQQEAEQTRLAIENIRFEAFMNGYKNHEYVIEVTP